MRVPQEGGERERRLTICDQGGLPQRYLGTSCRPAGGTGERGKGREVKERGEKRVEVPKQTGWEGVREVQGAYVDDVGSNGDQEGVLDTCGRARKGVISIATRKRQTEE